MAENLSKNKLLLDEKQGKKKLYKSWKLYAITLGVIGVSLGVGLGVGLGVKANKVPSELNISNQDITNAINNASYTTEVIMNSSAASITEQITGDFMKAKLIGNNAAAFKVESFKLNKITVGNNNIELSDTDLLGTKTINAKINYNYDTIINQTTNLTITVKISNQQIVNAINNVTKYNLFAAIGDTVASITNQINDTFIKTQLSDEIASAFNPKSFKFTKVTINGNDLQDSDLTTEQTINAKINYNYDTIINQTTNLIITVTTSDVQQIANQINNSKNYLLTVINGTNMQSITDQINSKFIKQQLTGTSRKLFNNDLFTLNNITINNRSLTDNDLPNDNIIKVKINYNYGAISKSETNLTINFISTVLDPDIVKAIKNITYEIKTTKNNSTKNINNQINVEFIQEELTKDIATKFDSKKFKFNKITINNNDLQDSDLTTSGIVSAKINFSYNSLNYESNLIIIIE